MRPSVAPLREPKPPPPPALSDRIYRRSRAHLPQRGSEILLAPAAPLPQRLQHTRPVSPSPPSAAAAIRCGGVPAAPPLPVRGRGGAAPRPGTGRAARSALRRCCPRRSRHKPGTGGPRTCFPPAPGRSGAGSGSRRQKVPPHGGWGAASGRAGVSEGASANSHQGGKGVEAKLARPVQFYVSFFLSFKFLWRHRGRGLQRCRCPTAPTAPILGGTPCRLRG